MDRRWIEVMGKRHFEGNSAMSKTQRETRKKSHQNLRLAETQSQGSGMVGKRGERVQRQWGTLRSFCILLRKQERARETTV